jgi:signal transduction histidine kinase/predicted ATPase
VGIIDCSLNDWVNRTMVSSQSPAIHHFPKPAMPFVGRRSEVIDIVNHLDDPDCRLLTLTGLGGIGKTRLAIEATTQFVENNNTSHQQVFSDGVYFIALAPLVSSDLLAMTIADRLGTTLSGTAPPRDQLLAELEQKKILLLLDNFEHIMTGWRLVSDILAHAPDITILVTSRERLNLPEECVYDVQGMTVPLTDDVQGIESYSALLLFQQIAQKVDWRFALDDVQIPHVVRICRLVEGIPLAIEMAAAWVRVLSCREIADDLTRNFELLEATFGHIPQRHQSIRAVFDYSWDLLTEFEQQVLQKMSVFRGGFGREAAREITGATINSLLSLVDKSLLQHDTNERYQIHELLRQFAEEKLSENPQSVKQTHDLHCTYYADFLYESKAEFIVYDHNSPSVFRINADLDNIRVMWDRAIAHQKFEVMDRASDSLFHYHVIRDTYGEAAAVFQKAVAMVRATDSFLGQDELYTKLLSMLAYHALYCGLYESAENDAQRGLLLARTLSILEVEARCLVTLGDIDLEYGNYAEARQHLEEATAIYSALDETYEAQFAGLSLAWSYKSLGEYDLAREYYHQLILADKKRDADGLSAWILNSLGHLENLVGDYSSGLKHCTEAVAIFERQGHLVGLLAASKNLANAYFGLDQLYEARHYFHVGLTAYVKHGEHVNSMIINTLARIANLLAYEGDITRAIELTSFVQQHPHANDETKTLADTLSDELETELPPVVFQSAHARGIYLELKPLVTGFIEEFNPDSADESPTEVVSKHELELLQQVTESLVTGELFDENLTEKEQDSVRTLVDTVDTLLEKEKSKIMATFMESASHDLRTPLTVINTSLYLLERISDPDKQKDRLKLVKDQVTHLQTLIENLITMARLDGGIDLDVQPLDLNQLMAAIQQSHIANLTVDRDLDIQFVFPDEPVIVQADIDNLQQALLNIVENAVYYTPDGGSITTELYSDSHGAIVEVSDTGIGIEEDDLPYIFERFYRVDKARTERGRSGLGLAITQKIIDAHQGHIEVVSTPDKGSTFRVVLPHVKVTTQVRK